jgi:hypothetical protein
MDHAFMAVKKIMGAWLTFKGRRLPYVRVDSDIN